ncbi:MAG: hypothetical protein II888_06080 [Clostridia bacterium]|nr:hypothetical protein [Clostridia bacterium]
MFRRIREIWSGELIRPMIHRAFTRLVWGLFFALFLAFLISRSGGRDLRGALMGLYALLCFIFAWLSHLQMDGMKLPRLDALRSKIDRKRPARGTGDMIDFVDEEIQSYESLSDEERYLVLMLADLANGVLFLLLSFIL